MSNANEPMPSVPEPTAPQSTQSVSLNSGSADGIAQGNDAYETRRWVRMTVIFGIGIVITVMLLQFFALTAQSIALLFVAIVLGEAISPVVNRLARFMPRGVAVGVLFLTLIGAIVGTGIALQPQITQQTTDLIDAAPGYIERVENLLNDLPISDENDVWSGIQSNLGNFTMALVSVPMTIFTSLAQLFIVAFMAGYWTLSRRAVRKFLESLVPQHQKGSVRDLLVELSATVGGYVRGTGIGALIVGTVVYIGLAIMGVNYPLIMAIFAAFGELIPILGPNLAAIPAVIVAFLESWQLAVAVVVFYVVVQQLESVLLVPLIMDNQANIPPLLVIVSVSFGGAIAGVIGAIVAIPAAGALRVITMRVIAPAIRRWTGADATVHLEM